MTSGESIFEVVGGSVPGRSHVRAGRNNQDAFAWLQRETCLVAVVSDGCSSSPRSEVGAQLGARLLAELLLRELPACDGPELLERARLSLCAELAALARSMGGCFAQTVSDFLLFTLVGVAVGPEQACLFSLGDGLVAMNGEEISLGPFPDNEPPYLAYALLDGAGEAPRFQIHRTQPTADLQSVLLATDGVLDLRANAELVGPLSQFWTEDRYYRNADMVRRCLAVANRERPDGRLLPDDTTLIALRRMPRPQSGVEPSEGQGVRAKRGKEGERGEGVRS